MPPIDRAWGRGNDNTDSLSATQYKTGGRKVFYKEGKENTLLDVSLFYVKELPSIKSKIDVLVSHSYQDLATDKFNYAAFSYRKIADPAHPEKKDTIAGSSLASYRQT